MVIKNLYLAVVSEIRDSVPTLPLLRSILSLIAEPYGNKEFIPRLVVLIRLYVPALPTLIYSDLPHHMVHFGNQIFKKT